MKGQTALISVSCVFYRLSCHGLGINSIFYCASPWLLLTIRKTCPCNVYPLDFHFYIAKLGYAGTLDCWYSLEPPRRGKAVLTCTHDLCFEQK